MHSTTTKRTIRIVRSNDAYYEPDMLQTRPKNHPLNIQQINPAKIDPQHALLSIFKQNKQDQHITAPLMGSLGAIASRAKAVSRGGIGKGENFNNLKRELLRTNSLYEDPDFPATNESLYYTSRNPTNFTWKRPHEICQDPKFIIGDASRFDVVQGELGDCWLLAAVACLSMQKMLMNQVVPQDQTFDKMDYCGAFRFHFWHFGEWKEVIVDDRLPTKNNRLVFMQSATNNEFWSALLEKAYAKLYGCYELLKGGSSTEAMEDFTGGIAECLNIKEEFANDRDGAERLYEIMSHSQSKLSMMGCSIEADPRQPEAKLSNGLVMGHAYSITSVKEINARIPGYNGPLRLIRIRNPWGDVEWKGEWSDNSDKWRYINERERAQLGLNFESDGEFWMSFEDFVKNFERVDVCHLGPQSLGETLLSAKSKRRWEAILHSGHWRKGVSAGGCLNYSDTFWTNPQFRITISDPDTNDKEDHGTLIIGLLQKNTRSIRNRPNDLPAIGYVIYKVDPNKLGENDLLDRSFFKFNRKVAMSPSFINLREVSGRHKLDPGTYIVVPSTFEPGHDGEFLLRIFAERAVEGKELDTETSINEEDSEHKHSISVISEEERAKLQLAFHAVAGQDEEIDSRELRDVLNSAFKREQFFKEFSIDTCRSIIAMMDVDLSGRLGFEEFITMWTDLKLWKSVFKCSDKDNNGTLNSYELRHLLNEIGFKISNKLFQSLVVRFSSADDQIEFDDFIHCCVRLKTVFVTYKANFRKDLNAAVFDQDCFIQAAIYS